LRRGNGGERRGRRTRVGASGDARQGRAGNDRAGGSGGCLRACLAAEAARLRGLGGDGTAAATVGDGRPVPSRTPAVNRVENTADRVGDAMDANRDASGSAKVRAGHASRQAKGGLSVGAHQAPASVSASGTADAMVHPGTAGGLPLLSPGGHPGGPGGPGGSYSPDLPQTAPQSVPSLSQIPSSAAAEGSYTVVIPPTGGMSKELCLKGDVNRCKTVTVSPTPGRTMVLRWAGNVGSTRPSFDVEPCPVGIAVTGERVGHRGQPVGGGRRPRAEPNHHQPGAVADGVSLRRLIPS
jgi:hypothetical protein